MSETLKTLRLLVKHKGMMLLLLRNHLTFVENKGLTIWGSITDLDAQEVERLVDKAAAFDGPIIEIGTLFGFTTQLIAARKRAGQKVITVDNFGWNPFSLSSEDHREFTMRSLHYCLKKGEVSLFEGSSEAFFQQYDGPPPALVFIDAAHDYESVRNDLRSAIRVSSKIVSGHDYNDICKGVVEAVDEAFHGKIEIRGSVWSILIEEAATMRSGESTSL